MKVYVLTHCAAEQNYTPLVFSTKERAEEELKELFKDIIVEPEPEEDEEYEFYEDAPINSAVYEYNIGTDFAEITWSDDTYDLLEIFEAEVE